MGALAVTEPTDAGRQTLEFDALAGQVTVADGTDMMAKRIERVLTADPGMGVIRHVDSGYQEAKDFAAKAGVKIPMQEVD